MKIESETKDKSFVSLQKGEANPYITSVKRSSQAQISRYFAEKKKGEYSMTKVANKESMNKFFDNMKKNRNAAL